MTCNSLQVNSLLRFAVMVAGVVIATVPPTSAEDVQPGRSASIRALESALIETIEAAEPSVVAIAMVERPAASTLGHVELRPSPFALPAPVPTALRPTDPDYIPVRYATGVVVDREGLILTAYHALGEGFDFYVTMRDRVVRRARIKAADPRSDLAVLELELSAQDRQSLVLKPVRFGDASQLKKGQIVVALGNPYAMARDGSVSAAWGIVANLGRKLPPYPEAESPSGKDTLHHFGTLIQTDAKLNQGTSGGPLLTLEGEMVGLVTSLAAVSGYEQAAGYAFPVDEAFRRTVAILAQGREVEYGFLGVQLDELTLAERSQGLHGVRVSRVVRGLPGHRFGLRLDDIVTAVGDVSVHSADELVLAICRAPLDHQVKLHIARDGHARSLDIRLAKYPVQGQVITTATPPAWRGMRLDHASTIADTGRWASLGLRAFDDGVLVTGVEEGSPAWEAGIRHSTIVTHIGDAHVSTPADLLQVVESLAASDVVLRCLDPSAAGGDRTVRIGSY